MPLFTIVQKIMAFTLSACFVAHDIEYTHKLAGLTTISIICLLALFYFHILIYLKEIGYVEIQTSNQVIYIYVLRSFIFLFAILYCFSDYINLSGDTSTAAYSYKAFFLDFLNSVIVVIPEIVFRTIFVFRQKKTP